MMFGSGITEIHSSSIHDYGVTELTELSRKPKILVAFKFAMEQ